ncbi:MAG: hypothetical protein WDW20_02230 [Neisseriaceae bacterium]
MKRRICLWFALILWPLLSSKSSLIASDLLPTEEGPFIIPSSIAVLLSAELLYTTGYRAQALSTYYQLLHETKDIGVGKRALQLALSTRDLPLAKKIQATLGGCYRKTSREINYLCWQQELLEQNYLSVFSHLALVLESITETQRAQLFATLSTLAFNRPSLGKYGGWVHRAALLYPSESEAIFADALYGALRKREQLTQAALQRLHQQIPQVNKRTLSFLATLNGVDPGYWTRFFEALPAKEFHEQWLPLYLGQFLVQKNYAGALNIVKRILSRYPNTVWYSEAGYLASLEGSSVEVYNAYFKKAYHLAKSLEAKSRVAKLAALATFSRQEDELCRLWTTLILDPNSNYEKLMFETLLATRHKKFSTVGLLLAKIDKLPNKSGELLKFNDYLRIKLSQLSYLQQPRHILKLLHSIANETDRTTDGSVDPMLHAAIYSSLGYIYVQIEDYSRAEKNYRKAVEIKPTSTNLNDLGYVLLQTSNSRKWQEALHLLQKAYDLDTQSPEIIDSLGWAYALNHELLKALRYLKQAYQKSPSAETASHLIHVLWRLGQKREAYILLRNELDKDSQNPYIKKIIDINHIPMAPSHEKPWLYHK